MLTHKGPNGKSSTARPIATRAAVSAKRISKRYPGSLVSAGCRLPHRATPQRTRPIAM